MELTGRRLTLRSMELSDRDFLIEAVHAGEIWRSPYTLVPKPEQVGEYVRCAVERQGGGTELPLVMQLADSGQVVGSTRFRDANLAHRSIEISHIWVAKPFQRTFVNTEANYLMLRFAFDTLGCIRVQFRCDEKNVASRNALERTGARLEGIMRNERISADGTKRNALLFSVIDDDWPEVRRRLEGRLSV